MNFFIWIQSLELLHLLYFTSFTSLDLPFDWAISQDLLYYMVYFPWTASLELHSIFYFNSSNPLKSFHLDYFTEIYKVSRLRDSITETWYFIHLKYFKFQKNEENFFAPKIIWNGFLECIHSELQGPKESTSARYFFLCLKLVSN